MGAITSPMRRTLDELWISHDKNQTIIMMLSIMMLSSYITSLLLHEVGVLEVFHLLAAEVSVPFVETLLLKFHLLQSIGRLTTIIHFI